MKKIINIFIVVAFLFSACSHSNQSLMENIVEPVLKKEPKLIYPLLAQENNNSGTSTIIFTINKEGKVSKSRIHSSSGYGDLDKAAENYCKGLLFTPAIQNGEPIASNMKWDVQFNLSDFSRGIKSRISSVKNLYSKLKGADSINRDLLQQEIFDHHEDVISNIKDSHKLNEYIYSVINIAKKDEWKSISESYPLTFLLYHDFIERFADFDSLSLVKANLEYAIKQDLDFLKTANNSVTDYRVNRKILIKKIKSFVENSYPEINIEDLSNEFKSSNIS